MGNSTDRYDADRVLCYAKDKRVPSRLGAVEWGRDAVTEGKTPVVALAMAIGLRIDDSLVCWPSQKRLASDIRSTDRTVRNALDSLESQHIVFKLYLWRGRETTGCVYVLNVDGWLDDIWDDSVAVLRRVAHVRAEAKRLELSARSLPDNTELSTQSP